MPSNWNGYRKIPADIRAAQWDGTVDMASELITDVLESEMAVTLRYLCEPNTCKHDKDGENSHWLQLDAEDDRMKIFPGDWIVQSIEEGDFYRIPKDRFGRIYEATPRCEYTTYAGALVPRERCTEDAVIGYNVCSIHLGDNSDDMDAERKDNN